MATYALVPGAASGPGYWHLTAAALRRAGHDVVAIDLPCEDDDAGLADYARAAVEQIGDRSDVIVVAHSLGGFTGPLVCAARPVDLLVMLQPMIPRPGETPSEWSPAVGLDAARAALDRAKGGPPKDDVALFLHDTPPHLAAEEMRRARRQSNRPFRDRFPHDAWPEVPTRVLVAEDDRMFPADLLREVAKERLGVEADGMPGDHCPMLGHPRELADRLEGYRLGVAVAG